MTGAEWLACSSPYPMLESPAGVAGSRKMRLLACACCRRHWDLFRGEASRRAVLVAERFADGLAGPGELEEAQEEARSPAKDGDGFGPSCCCDQWEDRAYGPDAAASAIGATLETLDA